MSTAINRKSQRKATEPPAAWASESSIDRAYNPVFNAQIPRTKRFENRHWAYWVDMNKTSIYPTIDTATNAAYKRADNPLKCHLVQVGQAVDVFLCQVTGRFWTMSDVLEDEPWLKELFKEEGRVLTEEDKERLGRLFADVSSVAERLSGAAMEEWLATSEISTPGGKTVKALLQCKLCPCNSALCSHPEYSVSSQYLEGSWSVFALALSLWKLTSGFSRITGVLHTRLKGDSHGATAAEQKEPCEDSASPA